MKLEIGLRTPRCVGYERVRAIVEKCEGTDGFRLRFEHRNDLVVSLSRESLRSLGLMCDTACDLYGTDVDEEGQAQDGR